MILYHYRSIQSALPEIKDSTFRFASCEELNDPLESYLRVFWKGDKAAWEGLFRNYICSLFYSIECYLLRADGKELRNNTLMIDIGRFDDVPMGNMIKELGQEFITAYNIQKLSSVYGEGRLKVQKEELQMILQFIHKKALELCIKKYCDNEIMPKDDAERILNVLCEETNEHVQKAQDSFGKLIDTMEAQLIDDEKRHILAVISEEVAEDLLELSYIKKGLADEILLYPHKRGDESTYSSVQFRNWMTIFVDFPKVYINQLIHMLYPESYMVCFSANNDNSSMWGNYADNHKGVCLIYETDDKQCIRVQNHSITAKKVIYEGQVLERNFFESFGRLTYAQVNKWLSGTNGISECYDVYRNENEWREQYWRVFEAKNYRKLKAWESEEEYRLVIDNTFYDYEKPDSRILPYDSEKLKGVIFGINTSEYDKLQIMKSINERKNVSKDFTFWQAEYDDKNQKIIIREKKFWNHLFGKHDCQKHRTP